jgi:ATP-dependent Lon protease
MPPTMSLLPEDIHSVGTIATVLQMLKLPDGTVKVLVEGVSRATNYHLMMEGVEHFSASVDEPLNCRCLAESRGAVEVAACPV